MKKILAVLVLGLALVGSCFAEKNKEVVIYSEDEDLKVFNALSATIENPYFITDLPEDMLKGGNTYVSFLAGKLFYGFRLNLNEKDFITEERPVVRMDVVIYSSKGYVKANIYVSTYKNKQLEGEKTTYYSLYCYSLDTWYDEVSFSLRAYPRLRTLSID